MLLAAAAARTTRIRLVSAVSVLSSDDPIRLFQQFATLDLISGGRAEIIVGRGSFIESYPLFGIDLRQYDTLFAEKLGLLLKAREATHVHWSGSYRAPLGGEGVYPRPVQTPLPVRIGVGGTSTVSATPWLWVVQTRTDAGWTTEIVPAAVRSRPLAARGSTAREVRVTTVDRLGVASQPATLRAPF